MINCTALYADPCICLQYADLHNYADPHIFTTWWDLSYFVEMQIHATVGFCADLHLMSGCKFNNLISKKRICIEVLDPHMMSG